jgi:uncharacterized alpha-E superfamily protein
MAATFASARRHEAADPVALAWLLDASDSLGTFRARYVRPPEWASVLELLFDRYNPRSVSFQVGKIAAHVPQLPDAETLDVLPDLARVDRACSVVPPSQADRLGSVPRLEALLDDCERLALLVSDSITARYFSHAYELPHVTSGR